MRAAFHRRVTEASRRAWRAAQLPLLSLAVSGSSACAPGVDAPEHSGQGSARPDGLHFEVRARGDGQLEVESRFALDGTAQWVVDDDSAAYFSGLEYATSGGWRRLAHVEGEQRSQQVEGEQRLQQVEGERRLQQVEGERRLQQVEGERRLHCDGVCRVRYRFDVAAAAAHHDAWSVAKRAGETWFVPASSWVLRPTQHRGRFTFRVEAPPRQRFVAGNPLRGESYVGHSLFFRQSTYAAFGHFSVEELAFGDRQVTLALVEGEDAPDPVLVRRWVSDAAHAVAQALGRFPVERALVAVVGRADDRLHGQQLGLGGAAVILEAGRHVRPQDYADDWIATHELVHLAFPSMRRRYLWLNEGLATYLEPLARARFGSLSETEAWQELLGGMHKPLAEKGRRGFEVDGSWAATYWGGALFWLLADVELRKATANRWGVMELIRAGVDAGGTTEVVWTPREYFDAAAPPELNARLWALYQRLGFTAAEVDLAALWQSLGVVERDGGVQLDDTASLADVRRAIVPPRPTGAAETAAL